MKLQKYFLVVAIFLSGCSQNDSKRNDNAIGDTSVKMQAEKETKGSDSAKIRQELEPVRSTETEIEKTGSDEKRIPGQQTDNTRRPAESDFLKPQYKTPQVFIINPSRDTTIICKEGTQILIRKNSFVTETNNQTVSENVRFSVEEYYKYSDMLKAKLSTTSSGQLLETGGMLHITASAGDQKLSLKKGSPLEISFSSKKEKEGMQAFSGQFDSQGAFDWSHSPIPLKQTEPEPEFTFVEEDAIPFGELKTYYQKNFQIPEKAKGKKINGKVFITFVTTKSGEVQDVKLIKGVGYGIDEEIIRLFKNMPKWFPARNGGKNVRCRINMPVAFSLNEKGQITFPEDVKKYIGRRHFGDSTNKDPRNPYSYNLEFNQLGWINCDRFYKKRELLAFKVSRDNNENVHINIVFNRIKAIMKGTNKAGCFIFNEVPSNEEITIVAMAYIDQKPYMAIQKAKTDKKLVSKLVYKPFNDPAVKQQLLELDNLD